jgi:hypothetical protein
VQNRLIGSTIAITVALAFSSLMPPRASRPSAEAKAQPAKAEAFNPHDLNGIWSLNLRRQLAISNNRPPMTPWGQAKFSKVRSSWTNPCTGYEGVPGERVE